MQRARIWCGGRRGRDGAQNMLHDAWPREVRRGGDHTVYRMACELIPARMSLRRRKDPIAHWNGGSGDTVEYSLCVELLSLESGSGQERRPVVVGFTTVARPDERVEVCELPLPYTYCTDSGVRVPCGIGPIRDRKRNRPQREISVRLHQQIMLHGTSSAAQLHDSSRSLIE